MAESGLRIASRQFGDVTVLALTGQMVLDDGDLVFRQQIHDLVDQGRTKIVVDLAGLIYVDSSGVGMLAGKLKTVRDAGGDMKLVHVESKNQRVLGMMKLLSTFEVFDEEQAAVESFAWKG
jgi:anti-sigma B factor antagonist